MQTVFITCDLASNDRPYGIDCTNRLIRCAEVVAPYGNICYQLKPVGAGRNNVKTSCATRVCRACVDETACVAEQYLTLRTGCERHGRKNPLPFPMSKRSHVGNLRQIRKQGKGRSSKRKENRRLSFLFAPAAGAANPRAPQSATPPLGFSEHPRPLGANTLTRFVHPAGSVQRKKAAARKGAAPTCLICSR